MAIDEARAFRPINIALLTVSDTRTATVSSWLSHTTSTCPPAGVNVSALEKRFSRIWSIFAPSPSATVPDGQVPIVSAIPFSAARSSSIATVVSRHCRSGTGADS